MVRMLPCMKKVCIMIDKKCVKERSLDQVIAAILLLFGFFFAVIGATVLPVVGLLVAIPITALAITLFSGQRGVSCFLS